MINFYFFPFTFMDAHQARVVSCFFNNLSVLGVYDKAVLPGPMAGLEAKGLLDRVRLDEEKLALAEQKVRAYLDWAAIHKGNEKNLRALIRENVFFKDDSGVAAIRAGIIDGTVPHAPCDPYQSNVTTGITATSTTSPDSGDPLVFLKLADIHDRENQDIQAALDALDHENAALFAELKGDGENALSAQSAQTSEPGQAMTGKRIQAWIKAACDANLFDQAGIPVLVTTSRAVMDEFLVGSGEAINALDIDSIKVHENGCEFVKQRHLEITEIVEQMAEGTAHNPETKLFEDAGQSSVTGHIQIRFFPGLGCVDLTERNPGGQIGVCLVELNS